MATKEAVTRALAFLARTKPGTDLAAVGVDEYVAVLRPVPDELLLDAAVLCAREPGAFLPDAGTLYTRALDLADDNPAPVEAWAMAVKAASTGRKDSLDGLPEVVARALVAVGFDDVAYGDQAQQPSNRARFLEAYKELAYRERTRVRAAGLELAAPSGMKMIED